MGKIIRFAANNGAAKEVPFGTRIKLDPQFVGAKVEVVNAKLGLSVPSAKTRIDVTGLGQLADHHERERGGVH